MAPIIMLYTEHEHRVHMCIKGTDQEISGIHVPKASNFFGDEFLRHGLWLLLPAKCAGRVADQKTDEQRQTQRPELIPQRHCATPLKLIWDSLVRLATPTDQDLSGARCVLGRIASHCSRKVL